MLSLRMLEPMLSLSMLVLVAYPELRWYYTMEFETPLVEFESPHSLPHSMWPLFHCPKQGHVQQRAGHFYQQGEAQHAFLQRASLSIISHAGHAHYLSRCSIPQASVLLNSQTVEEDIGAGNGTL